MYHFMLKGNICRADSNLEVLTFEQLSEELLTFLFKRVLNDGKGGDDIIRNVIFLISDNKKVLKYMEIKLEMQLIAEKISLNCFN